MTLPIESVGTIQLERPPNIRLPLLLSERRILLLGADLIAVNGALLCALALRPEFELDVRLVFQHPLWFVLLSGVWCLLASAVDAYDLRILSRSTIAVPRVLKAGLLTAIAYLLIPFITPGLPTSRLELVAFPLFLVGMLLMERRLCALIMARPFFYRRTLIVGAGEAGAAITRALNEYGDGSYEIVGIVDDDPERQDTVLPTVDPAPEAAGAGRARPGTVRILGGYLALSDIITRNQVNTLVLAVRRVGDPRLLEILTDCLECGVELLPMPLLYEQLTGRVPFAQIADDWYLAMPITHAGTKGLYPLVKRLVDIAVAVIGLICLGLLTPFVALATYYDSPGPIFYAQWRVGKGGRLFKVYKFRSMIPDAERGKAVWAQHNDRRVTRVGRLLRATHIDEFPQFLNVLKGEMSLVGPRPERPEFVAELTRRIPFYRVRLAVKPGMAGWGLVNQGYSASVEDAIRKLEYDLYWIKHQSLWLDLVILLKTLGSTLAFSGR